MNELSFHDPSVKNGSCRRRSSQPISWLVVLKEWTISHRVRLNLELQSGAKTDPLVRVRKKCAIMFWAVTWQNMKWKNFPNFITL